MKGLFFLQCVIIFTITLVLAEWLGKTKQNVEVNNIINRFKELSITSWYSRCKSNKRCKAFGMKENIMLGQTGECFLLAADVSKYSGKPIGEIIELYVTEEVSIKLIKEYACVRIACLESNYRISKVRTTF